MNASPTGKDVTIAGGIQGLAAGGLPRACSSPTRAENEGGSVATILPLVFPMCRPYCLRFRSCEPSKPAMAAPASSKVPGSGTWAGATPRVSQPAVKLTAEFS